VSADQDHSCRELGLSEGTVKTHVTAIYRAFGASNRTEALLAGAARLRRRLTQH